MLRNISTKEEDIIHKSARVISPQMLEDTDQTIFTNEGQEMKLALLAPDFYNFVDARDLGNLNKRLEFMQNKFQAQTGEIENGELNKKQERVANNIINDFMKGFQKQPHISEGLNYNIKKWRLTASKIQKETKTKLPMFTSLRKYLQDPHAGMWEVMRKVKKWEKNPPCNISMTNLYKTMIGLSIIGSDFIWSRPRIKVLDIKYNDRKGEKIIRFTSDKVYDIDDSLKERLHLSSNGSNTYSILTASKVVYPTSDQLFVKDNNENIMNEIILKNFARQAGGSFQMVQKEKLPRVKSGKNELVYEKVYRSISPDILQNLT